MLSYYLYNARLINEGEEFLGGLLIENGKISKIFRDDNLPIDSSLSDFQKIDIKGKYLIPGIIDDQVHFREPGLTHKADIYSESKAAVAGGITSFMEMPNTKPGTLTQELLEEKYKLASEKSLANFSFYMGTSNDNIDEVLKTNPKNVCGLKIFLGSSTGNMLVNDQSKLNQFFSIPNMLIAVHSEDEGIIQANTKKYKNLYGDNLPIKYHPEIRSEEACYKSTVYAIELAKKHNTRLHILHLSTAREAELLENNIPLENKMITAEVCVHHLWFKDSDYDKYGTRIKWNPAIKTEYDSDTLLSALLNNKIDVVATDHAPHTEEEKNNSYFKAPSGGPLVQHSLNIMLELYHQGKITLEKIVEKMCHAPAKCFNIKDRGYIRKNYWADLTVIDINKANKVEKDNILYKCKWSPFEGYTFNSSITHTFINGKLVYNHGNFNESFRGKRLLFDR
jgi:dihydroorotase